MPSAFSLCHRLLHSTSSSTPAQLHAYFPASLLTRPSWAGLHNTLYTLQQHGFAGTLALDPNLLNQVSTLSYLLNLTNERGHKIAFYLLPLP